MSADESQRLHLFEAYGVELEYMIVSQDMLNVLPVCDQLIEAETGQIASDVDHGLISWSNELVLHVVELKTTDPVKGLDGLAARFHSEVRQINRLLDGLHGRLMPSAMHPWMNPFREMRLWPHDYSVVYETFNRIFDCRGHGWANLQSVHLNLPFANDAEFGRLHAAIRLILPFIPGLSAASPLAEGRLTGRMDQRLHVYRTNSGRLPVVAGRVIPEPAYTRDEYQRLIFEPMFQEIAPYDPDGILRDEFLNARGAIARFGRGSIEIRVIDIQECPAADLGVLQLLIAVLKSLTDERWSSLEDQKAVSIDQLFPILLKAIDDAEQAEVNDTNLLRLFGIDRTVTLQEFWRTLYDQLQPELEPACRHALELILEHGPLARRISKRLERDFSMPAVSDVAGELCECLASGISFRP